MPSNVVENEEVAETDHQHYFDDDINHEDNEVSENSDEEYGNHEFVNEVSENNDLDDELMKIAMMTIMKLVTIPMQVIKM